MGTLITQNIKSLLDPLSGTSSGVHIFIDEYGNVTQIRKSFKERLKYYIDPDLPVIQTTQYCVIGVNIEENGPCTFGYALGIGDSMMAYANYS